MQASKNSKRAFWKDDLFNQLRPSNLYRTGYGPLHIQTLINEDEGACPKKSVTFVLSFAAMNL